jgi:hypothetical protein
MPWWPHWPEVHDGRQPPGLRLSLWRAGAALLRHNMAKRQNRRPVFADSTKIFIKTDILFPGVFDRMTSLMFAARPFLLLNIAPAALAGVAARAITSTTITTIKG